MTISASVVYHQVTEADLEISERRCRDLCPKKESESVSKTYQQEGRRAQIQSIPPLNPLLIDLL